MIINIEKEKTESNFMNLLPEIIEPVLKCLSDEKEGKTSS
jgi:hypothetical protein